MLKRYLLKAAACLCTGYGVLCFAGAMHHMDLNNDTGAVLYAGLMAGSFVVAAFLFDKSNGK